MDSNFGRSIGFIAGGIGDQIYHLTQLRALASNSLDEKIDIACIHPVAITTLLANSRWAGNIIDARMLRRYVPAVRGTSVVKQMRESKYESAFILHRSTSFKLAAFAAGINFRVGFFGNRLDNFLLTESLKDNPADVRRSLWGHRPYIAAADRWIEARNLTLDDNTPTILPTKSMISSVANFLHNLPRPVTIVNLFSTDPARRWSIEHANETLIKFTHQIGGSILLNAGADASSYHNAMMRKWGGSKVTLIDCLQHSPSMERDIALYHAADGYLGVDSFTANLAFNCNLPATVLFAKIGDTLRYKPFTFPLYPDTNKNLNSIEPEKIVATCIKMFKSLKKRKVK